MSFICSMRPWAEIPGSCRVASARLIRIAQPRGREGCLWLPDVSRLRTGNLDRGRCDHFAGLILAAAFTEYCAPEQYQDFKRVTAAADIYSFGCILHDLFDGARRVPYQRQSCPGPVGAVIEKCTDPDPNKRFKSIDELRGALFWALSQPRGAKTSVKAEEWISALASTSTWEESQLHEFVRFIERPADIHDQWAVFAAMDSDKLVELFNRDTDTFETIASPYCEWASSGGFQWEYCDVLVRRLETLFEHGSLDTKSVAALAAASLGRRH
jgi:eukaryotic-like serine/threonine-protein kinase